MSPPPAPLWRKLLACLPVPTRRFPFVRIPMLHIEERRQRNRVLRNPRAAIMDCESMGELEQVAEVLGKRGLDWRKLLGEERAVKLSERLAQEMRDDG